VEDGTIAFYGLGDRRRLPSGRRCAKGEAAAAASPDDVRDAKAWLVGIDDDDD
jgi:hypothetical protein